MAEKTFEEISRRGNRGVRSRCPLCGQPNAGSVQMQVMAKSGGLKPRIVRSMSKRLCEPHTVELYQALEEAWQRVLGKEGE